MWDGKMYNSGGVLRCGESRVEGGGGYGVDQNSEQSTATILKQIPVITGRFADDRSI